MNVIGQLSAIFVLPQVGFVVTLIGIVLALGGYSLLRVTFVPIAFLLFAIPLPYFVDSILTLRLQLISSELGAAVIRLFRIPVYLDGNIIDLGNYQLAVAEACSGLRYLFPLLSLSFLAAYLFQASFLQRAIVFLSAVPITIFMNGLRIGLVGILVSMWGTAQAEGLLHLFEGWVIFIACAALLMAEIFMFAKLSGKRVFDVFYVPVPTVSAPQSGAKSWGPMAVCVAVLLATGAAVSFLSDRRELVPERTPFAGFPVRLGAWQGLPSTLAPNIKDALHLDDYILADYREPNRSPVNLYVAYYASQRQGESPHSPIVCIPGGGWQITHFERTSAVTSGQVLPFNRVVVAHDSQRMLVYYWFDERGRMIANEWWSKWYLFSDAILENRTDAALIRLTTPIRSSEPVQAADGRLSAFVRVVVPALKGYLPGRGDNLMRSASVGHDQKFGE
jgi:exosortase D (VPLPA-CTERM-specific)